jgi:hypothetical protein
MRVKRFQAVEVTVPSGSTLTRFNFPDQPQLRNAKIQGIQVYTPTVITATPLSGSTPVTLADMKKSFLTLYQGDLQIIYQLPLLNFNGIADLTSPYVFELPEINDIDISWTKSYIQTSTALATTGVVYSFGIFYYFIKH